MSRLAKACRSVREEFEALPPEQRARIFSALAQVKELAASLGTCPEGLRRAGHEALFGVGALWIAGDMKKLKPTIAAELPELAPLIDLLG